MLPPKDRMSNIKTKNIEAFLMAVFPYKNIKLKYSALKLESSPKGLYNKKQQTGSDLHKFHKLCFSIDIFRRFVGDKSYYNYCKN